MNAADRRDGGFAGVAPIAVIGMGNVLLGDDGVGPCVIGMLARHWEFPDSVELIDAGTPGLDLAGLLCGREAVIFVDTVAATAAPGEVRLYRDHELERALLLRPRVSPHEPALAEALAIAGLACGGPSRVLLIGVVPQSVEVSVGLSPSASAAAEVAADAVLAALWNWEVPVRRRTTRRKPVLWWVGDGPGRDACDAGSAEDGSQP